MAAPATPRSGNLAVVGYVLVFLSALFAAFNIATATMIIDVGISPLVLSAMRIYGAGFLLLVFSLSALRSFRRAWIIPFALFGVVGLVIGQGTAFIAFSQADVAVVLVIIFTAPLAVAVYQRVRLGERLPRYANGAVLVAVAGVALAVAGGASVGGISLIGAVFAVLSMIAYAVSVIQAAHLPREVAPLARTGLAMLFAAAAWLPIVPPWTLPFDRLDETATFVGRLGFSLPLWTAIAFMILVGSVGIFVTWIGGTSIIGAGASSVVGMAEPVLGAIVAWALLAQALAPLQAVGIMVTVLAIIVVEHARIRAGAPSDVPVDR